MSPIIITDLTYDIAHPCRSTHRHLIQFVVYVPTDPCDQPIYPPGFIIHCNVLMKQWTYNLTAGQCMEFYYYACGEDRKGYNVFSSEQECMKTCIHKGNLTKNI